MPSRSMASHRRRSTGRAIGHRRAGHGGDALQLAAGGAGCRRCRVSRDRPRRRSLAAASRASICAETLEAERAGREAERFRLAQARRSVLVRRALGALAEATVAADAAAAARAGADRAVVEALAVIGVDAELDDVPALRRRLHADALRAERLVAVRLEWKAAIAAREAAVDEDARAQRTLVAANAAVAACDAEIVRRREELVLLDGASEARQAEIAAADAVQALGRRRELATAEDQLHRLHEHAADARLAYDLAVADHMTATAPRWPSSCATANRVPSADPVIIPRSPPLRPPSPGVDPRCRRPPSGCRGGQHRRDRQLGMVESLRTSLGFHAARSIDDLMEAAETAAELAQAPPPRLGRRRWPWRWSSSTSEGRRSRSTSSGRRIPPPPGLPSCGRGR